MVLNFGIHKGVPDWGVQEFRPPGYSRIYFVTGGKGFYHDDRGIIELRENHVYLLPTQKIYSLTQSSKDPFRCIYFHYDFFPGEFRKMIEISLKAHPFLKTLQKAMKLSIQGDRVQLFHTLAEAFRVYCHDLKLTFFSSGILTPILEFIGENIKEDLSLSVLSRRAGYNEQYFIRLFKKEMGMTPHQYIIAYRIKEARKLLIQGNSVTATASETGFSDVKTFSRCFRKSTLLSPSDFVKLTPHA